MKAKQLQWSEKYPSNQNCSYDHAYADCAIGRFQIEWKGWKENDAPVLYLNDNFIAVAKNFHDAQQLAQGHLDAIVNELVYGK